MLVDHKQYPSKIGDNESRFFIYSLPAAFEPMAEVQQKSFEQVANEYMYMGSIWYANKTVSHFYLNIKGKTWMCITEPEERYLSRVRYIKVMGSSLIVEKE